MNLSTTELARVESTPKNARSTTQTPPLSPLDASAKGASDTSAEESPPRATNPTLMDRNIKVYPLQIPESPPKSPEPSFLTKLLNNHKPTSWAAFQQSILQIKGGKEFDTELKRISDPTAKAFDFPQDHVLVSAFHSLNAFRHEFANGVLCLPVGRETKASIDRYSTASKDDYSLLVFYALERQSCVVMLCEETGDNLVHIEGIDAARSLLDARVYGRVRCNPMTTFPSAIILLGLLVDSNMNTGSIINFQSFYQSQSPSPGHFEDSLPATTSSYSQVRQWLTQYFTERKILTSSLCLAMERVSLSGSDIRCHPRGYLKATFGAAGLEQYAGPLATAVADIREPVLDWFERTMSLSWNCSPFQVWGCILLVVLMPLWIGPVVSTLGKSGVLGHFKTGRGFIGKGNDISRDEDTFTEFVS